MPSFCGTKWGNSCLVYKIALQGYTKTGDVGDLSKGASKCEGDILHISFQAS